MASVYLLNHGYAAYVHDPSIGDVAVAIDAERSLLHDRQIKRELQCSEAGVGAARSASLIS